MFTGASLIGAGGVGFALHSAYLWTSTLWSTHQASVGAGTSAAGGSACICEVTCPTFPECPPCICAECLPERIFESGGLCPQCLTFSLWLGLVVSLAISFFAGYWCNRCFQQGGTVQTAVNVAIASGDPLGQPHIPSSRVARRRVLSEYWRWLQDRKCLFATRVIQRVIADIWWLMQRMQIGLWRHPMATSTRRACLATTPMCPSYEHVRAPVRYQ